ncbi:hypothetical protein PR202_gb08066 [Eleusine coracana subsp. coracana]|uniref:Protein kinase domain-containing protein n=1 Tax=Eleusine coracana subsp. coracana TaxID=191504 RepID=A0AAV5EEK7_ELECO|nr:hypothetical protein PR202_gb08066 [Eleusine coracana subsp. coracana]
MSSRDDGAVEVPELTLRELNNATLSFSEERLIGEGFCSTVFMASLRGGKDAVAKRIDLRPYGAAVASDYKRHVSAASRLRHENVVRPAARVLDRGRGNRSLSWAQRVRIALHTAKGLEYLHDGVQPPVTHGSVRSSNVLLFEGFRAQTDGNDMFKIASAYNEHTGCEPVGYIAAEGFMMGLTRKSDVFGFGVVLLELLTGRKAFDQTLPVPILVKWLARIAARCVESKPSVRPSMGTVAREITNDIMRGQQGYGAVLEG